MRFRRMESILDAVGQTPVVRLKSLERETPGVKLYLKLEYMNPGGSVKDRPARQMILDAVEDGRLTKDRILIDSTSGNTGVAYSLFGAALGHRVQLVMPSNVSKPRKDITQAFGTELVYSDPMLGSDGAIEKVKEIVAADPERYFYPDQYANPSNPRAHYLGTGSELLEQLGDELRCFVAGLGTTGTIMGTTRRLKEHARPIRCVAVEPAEALHGLEGLKHMATSIVPPIYDPSILDEVRPVGTEDGWDMSDRLAEQEGLHVGHSTGANAFAAWEIGKEMAARGESGAVVAIACDRGDRYFAPMKWEQSYLW
ncbi:MAG TPA: cysteine synthase family protein [Polyangiaceae bacterium LLY-WYZ-15_(1-7)]|nr:cysteine synthase [Myxococcales bacterium]MAT24172.1 cysteine synthase [Sandaracinus sp.]HJK94780.1 cysteine synthase family protein [Polyangiaceae bacterium LLY-WYZ-15_(1-7)]MBJ74416.1 cysteine synthase [Sandaracinus sp.]HJL00008.1 cysteine synthase family protein [Polyangiaceae bacterium LLY-WYZ-15_(1-7)]